MRQENLALSVTADVIRKRDVFEIIMIVNPASTGITAYVNLRGGPATSADVPILSGGAPLTITLGVDDVGASIVAASATPTVILLRESFQSQEDFLTFGPVFIAVAAASANFWSSVSGTAIQTAGSYTEARADTLRAKTTNGLLDIPPNGTGGGRFGSTNNLSASSNFMVGRAGTSTEYASGDSIQDQINTTLRRQMDSTGMFLENATPLVVRNGNGSDARFTVNSTDFVAHTPSAGGNIRSSCHCIEQPIVNTSVVASGDLVEYAANTNNNRVQSAAAASTNIQFGYAVSGGTGNAGGTVYARIVTYGYIPSAFLADTGGVTYGQYAKVGGNNANRVISTAAASLANFGIINLTASATNPTNIFFKGPGA